MGCDCCKKVNPADYSKCQKDMERIMKNRKNKESTSPKLYIAPCGEKYTFGAKFTQPKKKKRRK